MANSQRGVDYLRIAEMGKAIIPLYCTKLQKLQGI